MAVLPPTIVALGLTLSDAGMGAFTVNVPLRLAPLRVIVTGPDVAADTALVVIGTVPDVLPAATVTVAGTEAAAFVVLTVILSPPTGAGLARTIRPLAIVPPVTAAGDIVNL